MTFTGLHLPPAHPCRCADALAARGVRWASAGGGRVGDVGHLAGKGRTHRVVGQCQTAAEDHVGHLQHRGGPPPRRGVGQGLARPTTYNTHVCASQASQESVPRAGCKAKTGRAGGYVRHTRWGCQAVACRKDGEQASYMVKRSDSCPAYRVVAAGLGHAGPRGACRAAGAVRPGFEGGKAKATG